MSRRHALTAILIAAGLAIAGSTLHVDAVLPSLGASPAPAPVGADHAALQATGPNGPRRPLRNDPNTAGDWIVRADHAGRRVGKIRFARADLEQRGWHLVISDRSGESTAGT